MQAVRKTIWERSNYGEKGVSCTIEFDGELMQLIACMENNRPVLNIVNPPTGPPFVDAGNLRDLQNEYIGIAANWQE